MSVLSEGGKKEIEEAYRRHLTNGTDPWWARTILRQIHDPRDPWDSAPPAWEYERDAEITAICDAVDKELDCNKGPSGP